VGKGEEGEGLRIGETSGGADVERERKGGSCREEERGGSGEKKRLRIS